MGGFAETVKLFSIPIFIQRRHPYTRNVNSEMFEDSKKVFLHCGDISDAHILHGQHATLLSGMLAIKHTC